jgi:D-alanine-D-alanine ligase
MANRTRIIILTATNLRTSTGSTNTVLNLLDNLASEKYEISIGLLDELVPERLKIAINDLKKDPTYIPFDKVKGHGKVSKMYSLNALTLDEMKKLFDFAIVAIYNEFGEDGKTLGFLELAGIPYLSPRLSSSAVAFDKEFTKAVLRNNNILTPESIEVNKSRNLQDLIKIAEEAIPYPLIVKPTSNGASRGTTLVKKSSGLSDAIKAAFYFSDDALIEQYINGQEFTVGVIGKHISPRALPPVMIKTKNSFFDYEAKYVKGFAEEICPAPIDNDLESKLKDLAIRSYRAIKAESHSRVDMISQGDKIYVLEINSFPGLIGTSLFPKELIAAGISLAQFLDTNIAEKLASSKGLSR